MKGVGRMYTISVDTRDRKPIYEQLCDNIKEMVLKGFLKPKEQLPGVRTLAVQLAINPNTIAKAYAELEHQGIIYSIQGRGSFVCDDVSALAREQKKALLKEAEASLKKAHEAGADREEILKIIDTVWRDKNV